jgi:putative ubiquitin-RnfH superfamily antitoxin RatB of RatAB toxin-antitoxin module
MAPADGASAALIGVEVVYCAGPHQIDLTPLRLAAGACALDAVQASGVLQRHALDPATLDLGVWGRRCEAGQALRERDRVEIYRPLLVDPKEARRQRYKGARASRRTGG